MIPKNIDTPLKNEMNIDEIPTPETDAHTLRATDIEGGGDFNAVHIQVAKDLERRLTIEKNRANEMGKLAHANACEAMEYRRLLTIAREALKKLDNWLMRDAQHKQIIEEALTQTAPGE